MSDVTVDEEALRATLVAYALRTWDRGWVANHDGNLSARLGEDRFLATPTAVSKGDMRPEWLIVVGEDREVLQGTRRAFSEFKLHAAAYRARPDIGVVVHAHPPNATAFAVSGAALPHPFLAEAVATLGPTLPLVPFGLPGEPVTDAGIASALGQADVAILAQHGVLAVGGSFEQAWLRMELVEHLATIALKAQALGGVLPLPAETVRKLAAKGRPASNPSFGAAPVSTGSSASGQPGPAQTAGRPNLGNLVSSALRRHHS
jgi:L-fuculose-phosphate aldolase